MARTSRACRAVCKRRRGGWRELSCGGGARSLPRSRGGLRPSARRRRCLYMHPQDGDLAMRRLHLHVAVDDLTKSIGFYSTLFGAEPSVTKSDYAKWMLEDPRVNFAISQRGHA